MLIKMSEKLKEYKSGHGIFIWKRFSWTKIEASIVKCWVMQNGWGLYFTPAGGTFYKRRMSEKLGHEPRVQRQFWDSLSGSLQVTTWIHGVGGDLGSLAMRERESSKITGSFMKINYHPWGSGLSLIFFAQTLEALRLRGVIRKVQKLKFVVTDSTT